MSAYELRQWYVYEQIYGPIGGERLDYVAAIIAERITNTYLRKGSNPASLATFLPKWGNGVTSGDDS